MYNHTLPGETNRKDTTDDKRMGVTQGSLVRVTASFSLHMKFQVKPTVARQRPLYCPLPPDPSSATQIAIETVH